MRVNSAKWNVEAIAKMSQKEFDSIYSNKVPKGTDLKKLKSKVSGKHEESGEKDS